MGSSQSTNSNNNGNNNNIVYHHGPPGSYPGQLLTRSAQTPRSTPSNPPSSSSSRPTQSSPTPTTTAPPNSPLPRGIISTVSSLFSDIYTPDIIHNHPPSSPTNHTPPDIQIVISSLQHKGLPSELIPPILDLAEYWSSCHRELKRAVAVSAGSRSPRDVPATSTARWLSGQEDDLAGMMGQEGCGLRDQDGEVWYLVSDPIGCVERYAAAPTVVEPPTSAQVDGENGEDASGEASGEGNDERKGWLRRVKVTTLSKDQGWSTSNTQHYGTYESSYTWFELGLLRDGKEVAGSRFDIQHNVHAGQYFKSHENTLNRDHALVKMAKPGDRLVLWIRANYPGWRNNLREASLTLYTAPFPPA